MDAVLTYLGIAVKLTGENYDISTSYELDQYGRLFKFTLMNELGFSEYELRDFGDFFKSDRENSINHIKVGYYETESFGKYIKQEISLKHLNFIAPPLTNYFFTKAEEGDLLKSNRLIIDIESLNYYTVRQYEFKIRDRISFTSTYQFPEINEDVNSSEYSIITQIQKPANESFTRLFFEKNLGEFIHTLDLPDKIPADDTDQTSVNSKATDRKKIVSKNMLATQMTYICWKMAHIYLEILPILAKTYIDLIVDLQSKKLLFDQEPDTTNQAIIDGAEDYENLPQVDKLIGNILHHWGVIKFTYSTIADFPSIFTSNSAPQDYVNYYNALKDLYNRIRYYDELELFPDYFPEIEYRYNEGYYSYEGGYQAYLADKEEEDSKRRMYFLTQISPQALAFLTPKMRLDLITEYLKKPKLSEEEQRSVVGLVHSFNNTSDANIILDYFLEFNNGTTTNFENLYYKLDDARLERYFLINLSVDEETNRKFFVVILYDIWKISEYNPIYPSSVETPNNISINTNSFFFTEGSEGGAQYLPQFNENGEVVVNPVPILEFKIIEDNSLYGFNRSTIDEGYEAVRPLHGRLVEIQKYSKTKSSNKEPNGSGSIASNTYKTTSSIGNFHLYQPLILSGFKPNANIYEGLENEGLGINFSSEPAPAFFLYYSNEFSEIMEFDAALNLTIDITVEIALFILFGGVTALKSLKYFRQLSKLKNLTQSLDGTTLILEGVTEGETMILYRMGQGALETVSVSSGVLMSLYSYGANATNDPEKLKLYRTISDIFIIMAITTGVASGVAFAKAEKNALNVLENATSGTLETLPDNVLDVLNTFKNKGIARRLNFYNNLNSIDGTISQFYNTLDINLQNIFISNFEEISDPAIWNRLSNTDVLNRWKQLAERNIAESANIDVIENASKVNKITLLYANTSNVSGLREKLEVLSFEDRWYFIDNVKVDTNTNLLNKLRSDVNSVELLVLTRNRSVEDKHLITLAQVLDFITHNTNDKLTGVLIEVQRIGKNWDFVKGKFEKMRVNCTLEDLATINGRFTNEINNLTYPGAEELIGTWNNSNRLFINKLEYDGVSGIVDVVSNNTKVNFINGTIGELNKLIFNNPNVPQSIKDSFVQIGSFTNHNAFQKYTAIAFDEGLRTRYWDTEVQFIDWFTRNYWDLGNNFVIEMESRLAACTSCQRYLLGLEAYAKKNGKTIKFKFKDYPNALGSSEVRKLLSQ